MLTLLYRIYQFIICLPGIVLMTSTGSWNRNHTGQWPLLGILAWTYLGKGYPEDVLDTRKGGGA